MSEAAAVAAPAEVGLTAEEDPAMKCPACRTKALSFRTPDDGPRRSVCAECGGFWVRDRHYWSWLSAHGVDLPELPPEAAPLVVVEDSPGAKLCPECGRILSRRRVGHGLDFVLERCPICGGLWFDRNVWEALSARNLHDNVPMIFSAAWERAVIEDVSRRDHEALLENLLGRTDFEALRGFREWLRSHPRRDTMMGYLLDAGG